jgi:metallo-beta-lactamase family protein
MKIRFLGAVGMVTGSSYILTSDSGKSVLIDFGMFQGQSEIENLNYLPLDFEPSSLTAAILTHAHLDHCGRLPLLLKYGFKGNIWMTPATRDLTEITLYDTAKVEKENGGKILFDHNLAVQTVLKFETVDYGIPKRIADFEVIFRDAGHILGAASLEIVDLSAKGEIRKIVFSGDLGNSPEDLEKPTELVDKSDAVIMESTYGDRFHSEENPDVAIQSEINTIESTSGTLLIPSFSLDRAQELLHIIMHLKRDGKVKNETLVYLDSPMAEKATRVYVNYPKNFNSHVQEDLKIGDIFSFPGLGIIENGQDSESLHQDSKPKVIIAGSGMMTGGRIRNHAAFYLPIENTRLLIVGYQAVGTLGRRLLEGNKDVTIDGIGVKVKASVSEIQSMSAHADQNQLLMWLKHIKGVKKVILTHGEDVARKIFSEKIKNEVGINDVILPSMDEEITL